jgi:DNA polymerase-1
MIMQVHDELVFEIKQYKLTEYKNKINLLMEQAVQLEVPLIVEAGVGENWDEAH